MKSKTENHERKFQIRTTKKFIELCRDHSDKFEKQPNIDCGSAAHFFKQAAREKLINLGLTAKFIDSII
jgi:hypothetical protein